MSSYICIYTKIYIYMYASFAVMILISINKHLPSSKLKNSNTSLHHNHDYVTSIKHKLSYLFFACASQTKYLLSFRFLSNFVKSYIVQIDYILSKSFYFPYMSILFSVCHIHLLGIKKMMYIVGFQ